MATREARVAAAWHRQRVTALAAAISIAERQNAWRIAHNAIGKPKENSESNRNAVIIA